MTAACSNTGKTPKPAVRYNPQSHAYEWQSIGDQGSVADRGTAWYMAMYDSVERLARMILAGMSAAQHEAAVIHCLNDLETLCRKLPEHANVNYFRNRIGWRLRDIRRRAVRENRLLLSIEEHAEKNCEHMPVHGLITSIDDSMLCVLDEIADTQLRQIAVMLAAGQQRQEIAQFFQVAPSTITRRVQDLRQILQGYYAGLGIDVTAHRMARVSIA
ncbi:hypothetical protein SE17_04080 [Kouleothrix aurantiaca]|uniref:RNA polymerase sigma-70 ECF-like HTH domain-containing protein n=1 Tax=Kouleothrix aurantiaca TaxID=186479 RepID=A0A0P9D9J6_9CHLR|nr:hypothetical protein SE17_04080 [Kouleothrix aurantiaca]